MANELTKEEEQALETSVDELKPEDTLSAEDLLDDSPVEKTEEKEVKPKMTDVGWSDYVIRQFEESELDPNGMPLVHGLRRVARLLLGPIVKSKAKVIQSPAMMPGNDRQTLMQPAVVEYTVVIKMCKLEQGMSEAYDIEFSDAADCYFGNIPDPAFAIFLTATAATRAEARTLRKALQINSIASEEKAGGIPTKEASVDGLITPEQVNFLNVLCYRNNINAMKYVNMGKKKYNQVEDVPYATAQKMVEHLSGFQNDPTSVPDNIKGYDSKWRE